MINIKIELQINDKLYLRDPQQTELGKRIVQNAILLIDEIGFDAFNFKKLANRIKSTETSVYRYFESKHLLFIYLVNWYWEWTNFRIKFNLINLENPIDKMRQAIKIIVDTSQKQASLDFVDTNILHRIVITEGAKAYHSKIVDEENKLGFFTSYKILCKEIGNIILEINPNYTYVKSLSSMIVETINNNVYFAEHLPRLTDISKGENYYEEVAQMMEDIVFNCLQVKPTPLQKSFGKPQNGFQTHSMLSELPNNNFHPR